MGWSIGFDEHWQRDIGYAVPAYCDDPGCMNDIDRGLSYVCGGDAYGGDHGCGLYFCVHHLQFHDGKMICFACANELPPYTPKREHPRWIHHKLEDLSWEEWRKENPQQVAALMAGHASHP